MHDFVVRRFDVNTLNSLYFNLGASEWVNSSEAATKFSWKTAEELRTSMSDNDSNGLFDLIIRKDSCIKEMADDLLII